MIDGRGGGIGCSLVAQIGQQLPRVHVIALGTNPKATQAMVDAGAHEGYTGEDAIVRYAQEATLIMGAMGLLIPHGLMGELSPEMVMAITQSSATKVLIPMNRCGIKVVSTDMPLQHYINQAVALAKEELSL